MFHVILYEVGGIEPFRFWGSKGLGSVLGFRVAKQRLEVLWSQGFRVLDRQIKDLRCCGILGWPDKRFEMLCSPGGN